MKLKSTSKSLLAAIIISASVNALADQQVLCPSAGSVMQSWQLIDTVSITAPGHYAVWGMQPIKSSGYDWMAVTYASAKDFDTAFTNGQTNVQNITGSKRQYALNLSDAYLCAYNTPNEPMGVALVAYKDSNQSIKFGKIDFKLLNAN